MNIKNSSYWHTFQAFFSRLFIYFQNIPKEDYPIEPGFIPLMDQNGHHSFKLSNNIDIQRLILNIFIQLKAGQNTKNFQKK